MRERFSPCRTALEGARNLAAGRVGAYGSDPAGERFRLQFDHRQVARDERGGGVCDGDVDTRG